MTRDLIIFKNIFLTVCVSLSGLGPSETHEKLSMRKMCDSRNKNKAKSCSFFDAIRRCSCGRSADWLKIDGREIPVSTLETARYATVRFAAPSSSHLHFEALLSLLGSSRKPLKTKFTPAVSSVFPLFLSLSLSISLSLFLSLPLSLSLRVSTLEKKISPGSAQLIQAKVRKAPVPSLIFLLWTLRSTCGIRTACWTRTAPVSRL